MSDEGERLHLGRARPSGPGKPRPGKNGKYDYDEDDNAFQRFLVRRKAKRAAKKQRLAAMTRGRRVTRRFLIGGTWLLGVLLID